MSSVRVRKTVSVLAAAALLAACGGEGPSAGSEATTESPEASDSGGAELVLWTNQADAEHFRGLYESFEAETGHELEIVYMPSDDFENSTLTRWATGERPDILSYHGSYAFLAALNPRDNLRDLSDEDFVERSIPGLLDTNASVDGDVYGTVLTFPVVFGVYYNEPLLEELGLEPPSTGDEMLELCDAINAATEGVVPVFEAGGSGWPPLVTWGAAMGDGMEEGWLDRLSSRQARIDDDDSPWLAAMRWQEEALDRGCYNDDVVTAQYEDSYAAVMNGDAAMVIQHSNVAGDAASAFGVDAVNSTLGFSAWSLTRPVATIQTNPMGTYYLPVTGDDAREAASLEFIRFVTGPAYADMVAEAGVIPTLQGVDTPDTVLRPLQQALAAVEDGPSTNPIYDYIPGVDLVPLTGALLTGQQSPEQIADDAQGQAEQGARTAGLPEWDE